MNLRKLWYKFTRLFKEKTPVNWRYRKCSTCASATCMYAQSKYKNKQACGLYTEK